MSHTTDPACGCIGWRAISTVTAAPDRGVGEVTTRYAHARAWLIATACALVAGIAAAQDFPARPVKVIVPFAPGGPVDVLARALGEGFRERTGQPLVVDNKPGGGTAIGANACKSAERDGYAFCLLTASTISLNPFLYANLSYDPQKDLEPLTNVVFTQQVMIVHRSVPVSSLRELVAYAANNPDTLNFGSFGIGGDSHLVFEWLKIKAGVRMTHIPYGGAAPALLAFERGDAHLLYPVASPAVLERIRSGLAKAIAVPEGQQAPALAGVPPFSASGLPPYDAKTWFGAFAPFGTPRPRIEELARHLAAVVASPGFHERFLKLGGYAAAGGTPDEFRRFLAEDRLRGEALVKLSGVRINE
ncbi:MAG: tripartite tricarboxylate transporter substrate binding protein [Hyphomicrobiales bacterium]|nr:tripartite tricarboxylate transporter substrate binding protein [Hyphomicrobiales bacterium]